MNEATQGIRVELDAGYTTDVRDEGTGPVVVFLHPTPLDRHLWDGVLDRVEGVRAIAYDLRGHGAARDAPLPSFFGPLADDLARLLDARGVERAHLVGHGYGGEVAQAFALRHPARLESLTLIGALADPLPFLSLTASDVLRDGDAGHSAALSRWFDPAQVEANGPAVRYARACLRQTRPDAFANALRMLSTFDIAGRLGAIDVPTRVLALEHDVVVPPDAAQDLADQLPHGELRLVRGAGPLLPIEDPERFTGLLDHLAALGRRHTQAA